MIIDHGRAVAAGTPSELKRRAGRNVIEVHVRDRGDLPTVAAALAGLDDERGPGRGGHPPGQRRRARPAPTGCATPCGRWMPPGSTVEDMSLRRPTLDEVFLALTGQAPTQAPDNAAGHPAA